MFGELYKPGVRDLLWSPSQRAGVLSKANESVNSKGKNLVPKHQIVEIQMVNKRRISGPHSFYTIHFECLSYLALSAAQDGLGNLSITNPTIQIITQPRDRLTVEVSDIARSSLDRHVIALTCERVAR